jgi:hypothetical protein
MFGLLNSIECSCDRLNNIESKLSQIQDSINGISCSSSSSGSECPPCPTTSSSPSCLDIAKIFGRMLGTIFVDGFDPALDACYDADTCGLASIYNELSTKDWGCGV